MGRYTHDQFTEEAFKNPKVKEEYNRLRDHRDIMLFAFRYSLGRRTCAPTTIQNYIKSHIDEFTARDRLQMAREIEDEDSLGDPNIDKPQWLEFRDYLLAESGKLNPIVL